MPAGITTPDQYHSWLLKANFRDPQAEEVLRKLLNEPESLDVHQLRITPLRVLSRALGKLSSRRIIDTYLRWLEIQRLSPKSNINDPWQNLITHWTQSLRARGFKLYEVVHEVENWKKANGPFSDSPARAEVPVPPTPSDLKFGWNQVAQGAAGAAAAVAKQSRIATMGHDSYKPLHTPQHGRLVGRSPTPDRPKADRLKLTMQDYSASNKPYSRTTQYDGNSVSHSSPYERPLYHEPKPDNLKVNRPNLDLPLAPIPANYVCNRCNGRGHLVNDCPTNDDPDYDIRPSRDYRCKFCKRPGVHYFLFCPQNPDPNSIYRKRQEKVRSSRPLSPDRGAKRSPSPSWEVFRDNKTQKLSRFSISVQDNDGECAGPGFELDDRMKMGTPCHQTRMGPRSCHIRGLDEFHDDKSDVFMSGIQTNNMPACETISVQPIDEKLIQAGTIVRDFASLRQDSIIESNERESRSSQLKHIESNSTSRQEEQSILDEITIEREKYDKQRLRAKQRGIVPGIAKLALEKTPTVKIQYNEFLRKLFLHHTSQRNPASRKSRPTALDIWDLNDKKRLEENRAVTETIMDVDFSFDEKHINLIEANTEPLDDRQSLRIEIKDETNMRDNDMQGLSEAQQESETGDFNGAIQALVDKEKQRWMDLDANIARDQLPGRKRARSSTDSSETEGTGRKKRREDLQRELEMIESLKRIVDSSEDIEPATVEKLKNGNISLEELKHISGQMEETHTPTPSKCAPCSSLISHSSSLEPFSYPNREGAPSPSEIECYEEAGTQNRRSAAPTPELRGDSDSPY